MDILAIIKDRLPPFARLIGLEVVSVTHERIVGALEVRDELGNGHNVLHGGALMSLADTLGAIGTVVNLPKGARTATLESKTNFFAPAPIGVRLLAEATPLHLGNRTMVWQTRITTPEGKLLAQVTQTQIVIPAEQAKPA